jgi:hypothetical protein
VAHRSAGRDTSPEALHDGYTPKPSLVDARRLAARRVVRVLLDEGSDLAGREPNHPAHPVRRHLALIDQPV